MTPTVRLSTPMTGVVARNAEVVRRMMPRLPDFGIATPRPFASLIRTAPTVSLVDFPDLSPVMRSVAPSIPTPHQMIAASMGRGFGPVRNPRTSTDPRKRFWTSVIDQRRAAGDALSAFLSFDLLAFFNLHVVPDAVSAGIAAVQATILHYAQLLTIEIALAIKALLQQRSARQRPPGHQVPTQPRVVRGPTSRKVLHIPYLAGPRIAHTAA
ncbi:MULTISPECIES: hypothetical protein [Gordonia]|uniref:hypothetical protein n=1 Tax=unclassified Gordonia (in: high G+C Gram-positive bacteria) TaxID=2657482 RepID=UPI00131FB598|nr:MULTISPECIES: hypothetical protein [unclassified Gordonia (in: high G+C Gram-positive bacteria)]MCZ4538367.1 hypothetical protein [Gordonia terrae]QHD88457.1 hypothetical protein GR168_23535 [Gordonia sp. JH63]WGJ88099.1 hypothetical protein QAD21_24675 [Gordonia sp. SMJS1]